MDRDEWGSSGTMTNGVFTPYAGAAEKQAEAEAKAQEAEAAREAQRKQLEGMTVEQLRTAHPDTPADLKKAELVAFILDEE